MPALPSSLISSLSAAPATCEQVPPAGLLTVLERVPDPRARRGIRHRLATVVAAAVCAAVAGHRAYAAVAPGVAARPGESATRLGIDAGRRPSEAMIRRLLPALDPDRATTVIAGWLAQHRRQPAEAMPPAIAVDAKTLRGSGDRDPPARPVMAAAEHVTGAVPASTDVDAKTTEITRLRPLLDQLGDPRDAVVTADALHRQRDHVAYLSQP